MSIDSPPEQITPQQELTWTIELASSHERGEHRAVKNALRDLATHYGQDVADRIARNAGVSS
ncbi:hypothetical protein [Deinococcus peraridilitoris]|uniref:Uncharacterized protein n=1 Tax=Deinococcus peraridilitoris (strain DSM 19664 / LMG 22246 / CIP 109416 / KR-200) TaxID=937777 RepID=L0A0Z7_DEIPD|nr:hypothetical protein [Deinococcus peraridilitoris]AFZ67114.1 hypothetical protein Deipe_1573 [Deinococcus peraridilitoris DSM 19664]